MELDVRKNKVLRIFLLVLAVIILLAIGSAMGSRFRHYRNSSNNGACGDYNNFGRGGRQNMVQGGRQFRMMIPRKAVDQNGQIQYINQVPSGDQAAPATAATTTSVK